MTTAAEPDYLLDMKVSPEEARELEKAGFRTVQKVSPSEMSEQLRKELIRIITTGDSTNDGAFTVAIATHVEKFVVAAREILMTEKLAQNDIGALMRRRKNKMFQNGLMYGGGMMGSSDDYNDDMMGNMSPIPNENFGVQAIKQMLEALRSMNDSPSKLVEALASAKQHGLHDVATELEKKLGVFKTLPARTDPSPPAPPAEGGAP
jgi:hypothetical protein